MSITDLRAFRAEKNIVRLEAHADSLRELLRSKTLDRGARRQLRQMLRETNELIEWNRSRAS